MNNKIIYGDCIEEMKTIKEKSIDLILTDLPYNCTEASWDVKINLADLFQQYNRIVNDNGVIALFGIEPFSSKIRLINYKNYKYDWIWVKDKATNFLNCKKQPMRKTENISIFYKKQCTYNFQLSYKDKKNIKPSRKFGGKTDIYRKMDAEIKRTIPDDRSYPTNLLFFNSMSGRKKTDVATEKPIKLLEYIIKTYTNESDIVLDSCMGSGSTIVAAKKLKRKWLGIEKNYDHFCIARTRIFEI